MKLSLIIPCYNEEKNIPLIFARLREALGARQDIDVLLVNNGSTDNSAEVIAAELTKAKDRRLDTCFVPVNRGYGHGILAGLQLAHGNILGWTHADMQTDPKDALTAFDLYAQRSGEKIIIKGKRKGRRLVETFFTFGMQLVASAVLGVTLDDVNAQPKLFSRDFYEGFVRDQAPEDFSLDLFLLYQAQKNGYTTLTIPVVFAVRRFGEAKGGTTWKTRIKLMLRTFAYIFKLRRTTRHRA